MTMYKCHCGGVHDSIAMNPCPQYVAIPLPVTAHRCGESEHHREEANKLRKLLGELERSNDELRAECGRLSAEAEEAANVLMCQPHQIAECAHDLSRDTDRHAEEMAAVLAERDQLQVLLVEVCETAADLNEEPNDAWRGATERTSVRNRIEEIDAIARGVQSSQPPQVGAEMVGE